MLSRFFLIFALAKLLTPAELGLFGLLVVTVSFSMLLIGADYYTYSQRELLSVEKEKQSFVIQHQVLVQSLLYILFVPLLLIIFWLEFLPMHMMITFFLLLFLEHVSQETNRLLVTLHKQVIASWVLFIRTGLWVFFVLPLMWLVPELNNINSVIIAWLVGSLIATLVGVVAVKKNISNWKKWPIDKSWAVKGLRVGLGFLLATLCFKGLQTFDRYLVELIDSTQILGVYVLYISIVMGMINFLEPGVFSFLYPRMVQAYNNNQQEIYIKLFKELFFSTFIIAAVLSLISWIVIPYIISWVGKPIYGNHLDELYILIFTGFMYAIGMVPHYGLYAKSHDRIIIAAHMISLLAFSLSTYLLAGHIEGGIKIVAISLLIAYSCVALIKYIGYFFFADSNTEMVVMTTK